MPLHGSMLACDGRPFLRRRPALVRLRILIVLLMFAAPGPVPGEALPVVRPEPVSSPPPRASAAPHALLSVYDGLWRRIDDPAAETARLAEIDGAVGELSWLLRRMATGLLRKTTVPPAELRFVWDGRALTQRVDGAMGRIERPVEPGGVPVERIDARGEPFVSHWRWTPDGLSVHWEQRQARGDTLYRLDPADERLLRVEHTLEITAIRGIPPIVYRSTFARLEATSAVPSDPRDDD